MKLLLGLFISLGVVFGSVDVNHAAVSELVKLKGIGKSKALKITEYIKQNGCFKNIDEMAGVKGIGKALLAKNKDSIKIIPCEKKH